MSKADEAKAAGIDALVASGDRAAAVEPLRRALRGRGSYLIAKAAKAAAGLGLSELLPELASAFDRLRDNGAKADPQCWGKNAIVKAMRELGCGDDAVYRRGAAHYQPEPVWGGQQDTAATLRGTCGLALAEMGGLNALGVLAVLADLLADPEKPARLDAARAVAQVGRAEGALLLRLKILCGDRDPEVTGQCLLSLLSLAPEDGIEIATRLLRAPDSGLRAEAAAALGESRESRAIALLRDAWDTETDPELKRGILISLGASRQEDAIGFLLSLVADGPAQQAAAAVTALAPNRYRSEVAERAAAIVAGRPERDIKEAYERGWR